MPRPRLSVVALPAACCAAAPVRAASGEQVAGRESCSNRNARIRERTPAACRSPAYMRCAHGPDSASGSGLHPTQACARARLVAADH
eukprot:scaffold66629_cov70-Phaeocystis_antarctica.AAC.8